MTNPPSCRRSDDDKLLCCAAGAAAFQEVIDCAAELLHVCVIVADPLHYAKVIVLVSDPYSISSRRSTERCPDMVSVLSFTLRSFHFRAMSSPCRRPAVEASMNMGRCPSRFAASR